MPVPAVDLEKAVALAQQEGHLDPDVDPGQIAFELNALFFGANFAHQLRQDKNAVDYAARAIEARLEAVRITPPTRRVAGGRR